MAIFGISGFETSGSATKELGFRETNKSKTQSATYIKVSL
jgi:hypothetical protein